MSDLWEVATQLSDQSQPHGGSEEPPPLHRLFVGSVPRTAVEATLRGFFEQCGVVRDLAILRDRSSGKSRGCAFVSYLNLEEAEAAIQKFDRQLILPGSQTPLEVRFAKNHAYVQAGAGPSGNRQLFFSRVPLHLKEEEIVALFSPYGEIESINIFKCRRSGKSKGCGFVEMQSRDAAVAAMESLDEQHVFDSTGTAISVRWADPELQQRKKKAMDVTNADNRMLFFAKVLRSTTEDDVRCLFSRFGKVHEINLFRAFQGAPTTKGCGLVTMSQHAEALAAIAALDGKHVWEGLDCPMVVKWMDTALQRRRREQHLASSRQPELPSASIGALISGQRTPPQMPYQPAQMAAMPTVLQLGTATKTVDSSSTSMTLVTLPGSTPTVAAAATVVTPTPLAQAPLPAPAPLVGGGAATATATSAGAGINVVSGLTASPGASLEEPLEMPPPGCNPDVIKLFVGNIPKSCTEEQLLPLFQSIGKVVELVILYDKVTLESKGSAFIWYAARDDAERAILHFNLRHVFPDPSGSQDRPLVVRRAKARSSRAVAQVSGLLGATTLDLAAPTVFSAPYYQRLVSGGSIGQSGNTTGGLTVASLTGGLEGLQLIDESALSMVVGMGMGMGVGMGMGGVGGASQISPGQVMVIGGNANGSSGLASGGRGAMGPEQNMQGIITLATGATQPAGLYDPYGTGNISHPRSLLISDYGTASLVSSNHDLAAATVSGGGTAVAGGYSLMLSAESLGAADTNPWDTAAAVAARLAGSATVADADATAAGPSPNGMCTTQSMTLTSTQLQAVNHHLYSVQTVSGATLQLSAGTASGIFRLLLSGTRLQVDTARHLVATIISGAML